jgi:hypothetical protein
MSAVKSMDEQNRPFRKSCPHSYSMIRLVADATSMSAQATARDYH